MSCPKCSDDLTIKGVTGAWFIQIGDETAQIVHCPECGTLLDKDAEPVLAWTRDIPKVDGLYWIHDEPDGGNEAILVEVCCGDGYFRIGDDRWYGVDDVCWWYGPLPIEKPGPPEVA